MPRGRLRQRREIGESRLDDDVCSKHKYFPGKMSRFKGIALAESSKFWDFQFVYSHCTTHEPDDSEKVCFADDVSRNKSNHVVLHWLRSLPTFTSRNHLSKLKMFIRSQLSPKSNPTVLSSKLRIDKQIKICKFRINFLIELPRQSYEANSSPDRPQSIHRRSLGELDRCRLLQLIKYLEVQRSRNQISLRQ